MICPRMEHQHLMELAVAAAPCGIAVVDAAGTILFANSALHAMCGYGAGALHGLAFDALVPGTFHESATGPRSSWAVKQDGTAFHVEMRLAPTICDDTPVLIATVTDCAYRDELQSELCKRHEFERSLAEIAAGFLASSDDDFDAHVAASQRQLAGLLGVERSTVWQPDADGDLRYTHVWLKDPSIELPSRDTFSATARFPWSVAQMRAGQMAAFGTIDELPDPVDRASHIRIGTRSGIFLPLMSDGHLLGSLTFATLTSERTWSAYTLGRLRLIGTVFANALARRDTTRALHLAHG